MIISHKLSEAIIKLITLDYLVIKKEIRKATSGGYETVLDLGCGTGSLAHLFSAKKYQGIDIDEESIRIANNKYPRYSFSVGDATDFKYDHKFDLVVIIGVIHHLNDKQVGKTMKCIDRHLKKNGKVLMVEAIPPVFRWNFIGRIFRAVDRGENVRELLGYEKLVRKYFNNYKAHKKLGGFVDYGVILVKK